MIEIPAGPASGMCASRHRRGIGSNDMTPSNGPQPAPLSLPERQVLRAWLLSPTEREAARRLGIGPRTLGRYLVRVRAKYALAGRPAPTAAALLARALQDGVVVLDEIRADRAPA